MVITVGILWRDCGSYLLILRDFYYDHAASQWVTGGRIAIPKGVIVAMRKVGEVACPEGNELKS